MCREANERAIRHGKARLDHVSTAVAGGSIVAAAAWLYWSQLAGASTAPGGNIPALALFVAVATWAGQTSSAKARRRAVKVPVNISAAAMIVGFAYLPAWLAIFSGGVGSLAALAGHARYSLGRWRWARIAVPLGAYLLPATAALALYRRLLGPAPPAHMAGWEAGAVSVLFAVMAGRLFWWALPGLRREYTAGNRQLLPDMRVSLVEGLANATCGLITVSVLAVDAWDASLVAVVGGVAGYGYMSAMTSGRRQDDLAELYGFSTRLARLTDAQDVAHSVLEEARAAMRADRADLVCRGLGRDRVLARCRLEGRGPARWERAGHISRFDVQALAGNAPAAMAGFPGELAAYPAGRLAAIDTLVAPLDPEDPGEGYLLVTGRQQGGFGYDKTEEHFFRAFASSAGTALRSGQLLSYLRSEVAVREQQARHDSLTGLPNRLMFSERLGATLTMPSGGVAVVLADLDDFKDVNDAIGHAAGDEVLRQVGARLLPFSGDGSFVARLGGDEFGVLVADISGPVHARELAEELLRALSQPVTVEGVAVDVRASMGVALAMPGGRARDAVNLMRHADVAMYAAKGSGDRICLYDPAQDRSTMRRLTLATELRRALEDNTLELWYQPLVNLGSGEVTGCEALLRWSHPDLGPISPIELIPVAENSGLIDPLTWWAIDTALGQLRQWRSRMPELGVAVNLSASSLPTNHLQPNVDRALSRAGLPAQALTLELTESSMLRDPETCQRALVELTDMGVGLSIDDYGTGFSSLSRLKQLPFRDLKIDRTFVKEMVHDKGDEAIVRSTIELARNLGRYVIAEGVEDKATLQRLAALGCHAAQGHYLAKPLPAKECELWLTAFMRWPSTFGTAPKLGHVGTGTG